MFPHCLNLRKNVRNKRHWICFPKSPFWASNCTGCNQFLFWIQAAKDAIRWHWGPRWRLPSESHGSQGCSQHPTCHGENLANKDVKWPVFPPSGFNLPTTGWEQLWITLRVLNKPDLLPIDPGAQRLELYLRQDLYGRSKAQLLLRSDHSWPFQINECDWDDWAD